MNFKCIFGHEWKGCICRKCGRIRNDRHNWDEDCGICSVCGKERPGAHNWDGCKCITCGKIRDEGHKWDEDCGVCSVCGKERSGAHNWDGCKCITCGKIRDEEHSWDEDCEVCSVCGKERPDIHKWNGCECSICGKKRDDGHYWWNTPRTCTICGKKRPRGDKLNDQIDQKWTNRHLIITKALLKDNEGYKSASTINGETTIRLANDEFIVCNGYDNGLNEIRTKEEGWSALHHAINSNDADLVKKVIHLMVDINAVDRKGWTPMHQAAFVGNSDIIRLLHGHGAELNAISMKDKITALHVAIACNCPDAVVGLLEAGADAEITIRDKGDIRPIHLAAIQGREEIIMILLDYAVDIDALEVNKSTALHAAAYRGNENIVRLLLSAGAKRSVVDIRGNTPLLLAEKGGHAICSKLLSGNNVQLNRSDEKEYDPIELFSACEQGDVEKASFLLNIFPGWIDIFDQNRNTLLAIASYFGHKDLIDLLLSLGAKDFIEFKNAMGYTPIITAAQEGHLHVVKALLENGADINSTTNDGWTALLSAADNFKIVKELLDKGANSNISSSQGYTPLMRAGGKGNLGVVKILLSAGADPLLKDINGKSAFRLSDEMGETECSSMLAKVHAEKLLSKHRPTLETKLVPLGDFYQPMISMTRNTVGGTVHRVDVKLVDGNLLKGLCLIDEVAIEMPPEYAEAEIESISVPLNQK